MHAISFVARRAGLAAALLGLSLTSVMAAPEGARGEGRRQDGPPSAGAPHRSPGDDRGRTPNPGPHRWYDGAHGHSHAYPVPGWTVRSLPPRASVVFWSGVNYGFFDGVWYSPGPRGYAVVRPPFGVVVTDLPAFRTLVTIGGIAYLYANGVYYRERGDGGYEVVPPPVAPDSGDTPPVGTRMFVYPRAGQSAEKQASDEYECHRWAVTQTGFDPTAAATSTPGADPSRRGDYQRARSACLEGRGYTVR